MIAEFLPPAYLEMLEAAAFYQDWQHDLGNRFLDAIHAAVLDIEQNPRRWPVLSPAAHHQISLRHFI